MKEFIPQLFLSLREYRPEWLKRDLIAGITIGVIALPLAMAFAIASGVGPDKGLVTAIIAGFLISALGGSRYQIGGPTGAFVVVIYAIVERSGYEGLASATLLASAFLILFSLLRLGSLVRHVPHPLITGFTSGIALIIFSSQMKDFFGLKIHTLPASFAHKWFAYFTAMPTFDPITFSLAAGTLATILLLRRFAPSIPWGIASLFLATAVTALFSLPVETIHSRFGGVPHFLPMPSFPALPSLDFTLIWDALTIALLAGIESLLSCAIADGIAGTKHRPNSELFAQGVANFGSILFGGIPATGAIARTAANIKIGAQSPISGMIHALTILCLIAFAAPFVDQVPLAALASVLIMVAWNISELDRFRALHKSPKSDITVLWTAFLLTIFVDITVAIAFGMLLALFFRLQQRLKAPKHQ